MWLLSWRDLIPPSLPTHLPVHTEVACWLGGGAAVELTVQNVKKLREMSPLFEMVQVPPPPPPPPHHTALALPSASDCSWRCLRNSLRRRAHMHALET